MREFLLFVTGIRNDGTMAAFHVSHSAENFPTHQELENIRVQACEENNMQNGMVTGVTEISDADKQRFWAD